jgi:hypothetical protein
MEGPLSKTYEGVTAVARSVVRSARNVPGFFGAKSEERDRDSNGELANGGNRFEARRFSLTRVFSSPRTIPREYILLATATIKLSRLI